MEELSKAEITLLGVVIGWVLGQGAELLRIYFKNKKLIKALNSELIDMDVRLEKALARCIQSIEGADNPRATIWPSAITHPIYTEYYPEICLNIKSDQRHSIDAIFGHMNTYNQRLADSYDPKNIKSGLLLVYVEAKWASELIKYHFLHKGKKELTNDKKKILEVNQCFQNLAKKI
ncbi:hypothetical protein [Paraglaciecola marina]|uniref:hypothetical protein n=1 Tax=Paraglaciecola marina TaxID=2500157 RepID=UPI0010609D84|nr:hypothetical protein [Paraglaciecola marina]